MATYSNEELFNRGDWIEKWETGPGCTQGILVLSQELPPWANQLQSVLSPVSFVREVEQTGNKLEVPTFHAGIIDREDVTNIVDLVRASRKLVGGPLVLLTSRPLDCRVLFELLEMGVTVLDRWSIMRQPRPLLAILTGGWPDARWLLVWCRRHRLSPMETRAVLAACAGLNKSGAQEALGCSIRTVESHWSRIFGKLGIRSTDGVVAAALRDILFCASAPRRPAQEL